MPSRAVGMGVCPRCGKPGTVVIKAGNYVYVKHGNTWHYIGTIDKVNLNKILIKNEKVISKNIYSNIKHNLFTNKIYLGLLISIMILLTFIIIIFIAHINELNGVIVNANNNSYKIINCVHATLTNNSNYILATCTDNSNVIYMNSSQLRSISSNGSSIFYVYVNLTNNK
ncbi:MAG: hypothetical protein ACP5GZ_04335 [Vulcanisaeta sp.]|uniref:hypothetical protein n=1 Tax=Vulcanisaeta sp. TaxID=2020871 RepID=UPI003D0F02B2